MMMTKAAPATLPHCSSKSNSNFFFNKQLPKNSIKYYHRPNKPSFICCYHTHNNSPISHKKAPKKTHQIAISEEEENKLRTEVGSQPLTQTKPSIAKFGFTDKASFLFALFACTTSVAFTSLVIAAVPTLHAMGRAAISFSKLADTAREELPSTMAAIRLSGMEISDLTLELSDLSQEIAEGVNKSAQAVQAAEAGIRQIGSRACEQTMSMIEERANLPNLSLQTVVVGAAKKTSRAVGQATKTLMNMISTGDSHSE